MDIDTSIAQIMTTEVVSVAPETAVPEIARLLWRHRISGVPVVEDGRVVGMVTEYDLIARDSEFDAPRYVVFFDAYFRVPGSGDEILLRKILAGTAAELMTSPAVVVTPDATIQDVATILYDERINAVPVVDSDSRLIGIVSRADIVRMMASEEG